MKFKTNKLFSIIKRLIKVNTVYCWYLIFYTLAAVCATISYVFFSKVVSHAMFELHLPYHSLIGLIGVMSLLIISSSFFKEFLKNKGNSAITSIKATCAIKLHNKITSMPYSCIENSDFLNEHENIFSVVDSYDGGIEGFCQNLFDLFANFIICVFFILLFIKIHIICVVLMCTSLCFCFSASKRYSTIKAEQKQSIGNCKRKQSYFYKMSHDLRSGKEIRTFNLKNLLINDYKKELDHYMDSLKLYYKTDILEKFSENLIICMGQAGVIFFLLIGVCKNEFQISDLIMYLQIIYLINEVFHDLAKNVMTIFDEHVYIDQFLDFIEQSDDRKFANTSNSSSKTDNMIYVNNLSFGYPFAQKATIQNVNFSINKSEKVAIAGMNGAGKSSIIKLLTGIYDDYNGDIFIQGRNIKEYSEEEKQKMFSVVLQNISVYPFTIKENITENSEQADETKLKNAAMVSGMQDKINNLDKGIETHLKTNFHYDAVELSGGEEQKLAIARAIYRDTPILIFDEPTAKMDVESEQVFYQNLLTIFSNKTVLLVTHRLSSIKHCDKIIFLNEGTAAEIGTFEELMSKKGSFYEMYNKQKDMHI